MRSRNFHPEFRIWVSSFVIRSPFPQAGVPAGRVLEPAVALGEFVVGTGVQSTSTTQSRAWMRWAAAREGGCRGELDGCPVMGNDCNGL